MTEFSPDLPQVNHNHMIGRVAFYASDELRKAVEPLRELTAPVDPPQTYERNDTSYFSYPPLEYRAGHGVSRETGPPTQATIEYAIGKAAQRLWGSRKTIPVRKVDVGIHGHMLAVYPVMTKEDTEYRVGFPELSKVLPSEDRLAMWRHLKKPPEEKEKQEEYLYNLRVARDKVNSTLALGKLASNNEYCLKLPPYFRLDRSV